MLALSRPLSALRIMSISMLIQDIGQPAHHHRFNMLADMYNVQVATCLGLVHAFVVLT